MRRRLPQAKAIRPDARHSGLRHVFYRVIIILIFHGAIGAHGWMTSPICRCPKLIPTVKWVMRSHQGSLKDANNGRLPANLFARSDGNGKPTFHEPSRWFDNVTGPPYLSLITEPDACDTNERMEATYEGVRAAVSTNQVAIVSVRVIRPSHVSEKDYVNRVVGFTRRLMKLAEDNSFFVVVSSDWIEAAVTVPSHGVHVKEGHRSLIPDIRQKFSKQCIVGTSAHSVSSAKEAWSTYCPDYFFVGTCYATASHPDKMDLEGPSLPGQVRLALVEKCQAQERPVVMAIGGINEQNCKEPVVDYGADGVATIRAVLQSSDPARTVYLMQRNMQEKVCMDEARCHLWSRWRRIY